MSLKSSLSKTLLGNVFPQEYLCVGKEDVSAPLNVFVSEETRFSEDEISANHLFLGYKPVIIGIPAETGSPLFSTLSEKKSLSLKFCSSGNSEKNVAVLKMQFEREKKFDGLSLFLFLGQKGSHSFLSRFHQLNNNVKEILTKKSAGNILLNGNLYDQVRIAYAYPRLISLVTLGDGQQFNMFPTDLNGPIGENYYAISLRHDGKVNEQVETFRRICISTVSSSMYKYAYSLGKNHQQPLKPIESFDVMQEKSEMLKLPVPSAVLKYRELELMDSIDIGIHRLHFFKIIHQEQVKTGSSLAHVHRYYAAWDLRQGSRTQYLIR